MSSEELSAQRGLLGRLVNSRYFPSQSFSTVVLGVEMQLRATSNTDSQWFDDLEMMFTVVFTVELLMRVSVHRSMFLTDSDNRWWNVFDSILIGASWVDLLPDSSAPFSKIARLIRMFRIVRVIRTVRFVSQIRVLLLMIMGTLQSLFWLMTMLLGTTYGLSIIPTQGTRDYRKPFDNQVSPDHKDVSLLFG
ncbi:unnamed protein product [Prorocentrum cordatum]|uniref:Ion transport domain-containing protein n=1 Tax=Prorocentrum cordatum TaxID=2364126 RepID=A0ABN9S6H4_9DINO|nr:unnamed protein product [Polarella glacialis]